MAIVVTQASNAITAVAAGGSTTNTITITPTAVGSLLFVTGAVSGSSTGCPYLTAVSDSVDGAWQFFQQTSAPANPGNQGAFVAWHANSSSTAARTITLTFNLNGSTIYLKMQAGEATGLSLVSPADQIVGTSLASSSSSVTISPAVTTTESSELVLAAAASYNGSAWSSPSSPWTRLWSSSNSGLGNDGIGVYQILSTTQTLQPTFTETGSSALVSAAMVTLGVSQPGVPVYYLYT